jgi:hypothetical protein
LSLRHLVVALGLATLFQAALPSVASAQQRGAFDPDEVAAQFGALGPVQLDHPATPSLVGQLTAEDGTPLHYEALIYGCDGRGKRCSGLQLRHDWTGGEQVRCILKAWKDRYGRETHADPVFAFEDIRVISEVAAFEGEAVNLAQIAATWAHEIRLFHALTLEADSICS